MGVGKAVVPVKYGFALIAGQGIAEAAAEVEVGGVAAQQGQRLIAP